MRKEGVFFHAKHAYMPNNLGYCGPDKNGTIREHLEEGRAGEELVRALQGFEAAYPFLKLIARNSGRDVFDYSVPEAYWIGNELLERVPADDFYDFSRHELGGMGSKGIRTTFRDTGGAPVPHHTFYVMGAYAGGGARDGRSYRSEGVMRIAELIDNCRISWGEVKWAKNRELEVSYRPVTIGQEGLRLAPPRSKRVRYNPDIKPFGSVKAGDVVSLHWGYACEVLTPRQVRNISKYTVTDLALANQLPEGPAGRGRR
jgi:Family of unknown function (DUF6390)